MIKLLLSFIWFIVIPILLGLTLTRFMKDAKNNLLYSIVVGYLIEFAIFQLFSISFTYNDRNFNDLYIICLSFIIGLCTISFFVNLLEIKNIVTKIIDGIKEAPKILMLLVLFVIGVQCYYGFGYMHIDEDDSNFVAKATISLQTNSLYKYSDTGEENEDFPIRYVFSPFPVYTAAVAKFTGYHPMAVAHTAFPVIFLLVIYINYYLIGNVLFKNDKEKSLVFLLFVSFIYMFGDDLYLRSNFRFALVRLWQGKAILGNLIIPAIILLYNNFAEAEKKFANWIALFTAMWSACLVSTMGFALAPIMLVALTIIYTISRFIEKKAFKRTLCFIIFSLICCAPNLLYAFMYAMEKGGMQ